MKELQIFGRDYTEYRFFKAELDGSPIWEQDENGANIAALMELALGKVLTETDDGERYRLDPNLRVSKRDVDGNPVFRTETIKKAEFAKRCPLVGVFRFPVTRGELGEKLRKALPDREYLVTIRLRSRLDASGDTETPEHREENHALCYMLEKAWPDLFLHGMPKDSGTLEALWEMLLVYQFRFLLLRLRRTGMYRGYVRYERNDDRFRGVPDVPRHIRENAGRKNGRIAYSCRERTADNTLNHFILRAWQMLERRFPVHSAQAARPDSALARVLRELRSAAPSWQTPPDHRLLMENLRPVSHPYYQPYERMRQLCVRIFRREGVQALLHDETENVEGFLIYLPDLFEDYVESVLYAGLPRCTIEAQSGRQCFGREIRPDFIVRPYHAAPWVMDAKCRPRFADLTRPGEKDGNVVKDYMGELCKLLRDMEAALPEEPARRGALIVPDLQPSVDGVRVLRAMEQQAESFLFGRGGARTSRVDMILLPFFRHEGMEYGLWKDKMEKIQGIALEESEE